MNIEEIDKWLDNEYGCSYTRLEELHDFVIEQDLKHSEEKDKEIERLQRQKEELQVNGLRQETLFKLEIERLNNKLKDIKSQLDYLETYSSKEDVFEDMKRRLNRIDKIIGSDKE